MRRDWAPSAGAVWNFHVFTFRTNSLMAAAAAVATPRETRTAALLIFRGHAFRLSCDLARSMPAQSLILEAAAERIGRPLTGIVSHVDTLLVPTTPRCANSDRLLRWLHNATLYALGAFGRVVGMEASRHANQAQSMLAVAKQMQAMADYSLFFVTRLDIQILTSLDSWLCAHRLMQAVFFASPCERKVRWEGCAKCAPLATLLLCAPAREAEHTRTLLMCHLVSRSGSDVFFSVPRKYAPLLSELVVGGAQGWDDLACCSTARHGCFANALCRTPEADWHPNGWPPFLFSGHACFQQLAARLPGSARVKPLGFCLPRPTESVSANHDPNYRLVRDPTATHSQVRLIGFDEGRPKANSSQHALRRTRLPAHRTADSIVSTHSAPAPAPSSPPELPRVALAFAGQLRTIMLPAVLAAWEKAVLAPLEWPAVFVRCSVEGGEAIGIAANTTILARVRKVLRPVRLVLTTDAEELAAAGSTTKASLLATRTGRLMHAGFPGTQALRWEALLDDIQREEEARGVAFDWVMRTRPDLLWRCLLPPLRAWPPPSTGSGASAMPPLLLNLDYLVITPRVLADRILRLGRRSTNESAGACGASPKQTRSGDVLGHDLCIDQVMRDAGATACELAPRTDIARARRDILHNTLPLPSQTCLTGSWGEQPDANRCSAPSTLAAFPCDEPLFVGFWRCRQYSNKYAVEMCASAAGPQIASRQSASSHASSTPSGGHGLPSPPPPAVVR